MMNNIHQFEPAIIKKYVREFVVAYRADGKAAAGLVLNRTPEKYKGKIVKKIREELDL